MAEKDGAKGVGRAASATGQVDRKGQVPRATL